MNDTVSAGALRRVFLVEPNARIQAGHYMPYTLAIARAFAARGFRVECIFNRSFGMADAKDPNIEIHPVMDRHWAHADVHGPTLGRGKGFGYETLVALNDLGASVADIVYVSTIGCGEFLEWLDFLARDGLALSESGPTLHLMLRCDPTIAIDNALEYSQRAREAFASVAVRTRVKLHADTELLAKQFSDILDVAVAPAPIPFEQAQLLTHLAAGTAKPADAPLHVVYLGDARIEKGYGALPDAIAEIWSDLVANGRMRFTLQSNFNVPGGEDGLKAARMRLARFGAQHVKLLPDALNPPEYYALLAEADAVLVPYDAQRYVARSSGILVEAAAAGVPVIATRGSWMATQVGKAAGVVIESPEHLAEGLRLFARDSEALKRDAAARQSTWLAQSSPSHFVDHILASQPSPAGAAKCALVCVDADDYRSEQTGHEVALACSAAGLDVWVMLLVHKRSGGAAKRRIASEWPCQRIIVADASQDFIDENAGFVGAAQRRDFTGLMARIGAAGLGVDAARMLRAQSFAKTIVTGSEHISMLDRVGIDPGEIIACLQTPRTDQQSLFTRDGAREEERALEDAFLQRCDRLLFPQPQELSAFSPQVRAKAALAPPPARRRRIAYADFAGCRNLVDVLSCAAPSGVAGVDWRTAAEAMSHADMVYVDEADAAGISAARWFMRQVYTPFLQRQGVSMIVAGDISAQDLFPDDPHIVRIGPVANMRAVLASASVVVCANAETSSTIAFAAALGKPFVGRPGALDASKVQYPHLTGRPDAFASEVLRLTRFRANRESVVRTAAAMFNDADPTHQWAETLGLEGVEGALSQDKGDFVEWSGELGGANRAAAAWARGTRIEDADLAAVDVLLRSETGRDGLIELWDSLLSGACTADPLSMASASALRRAGIAGCTGRDVMSMLSHGRHGDLGVRPRPDGDFECTIAVATGTPIFVMATDPVTGLGVECAVDAEHFRAGPAPLVRGFEHAVGLIETAGRSSSTWPARLRVRMDRRANLWVMQSVAFEMPRIEHADDPMAQQSRLALKFTCPDMFAGASAPRQLLVIGADPATTPSEVRIDLGNGAQRGDRLSGLGAGAWAIDLPFGAKAPGENGVTGILQFDLGARTVATLAAAPLIGFVAVKLRPIVRPSMLETARESYATVRVRAE